MNLLFNYTLIPYRRIIILLAGVFLLTSCAGNQFGPAIQEQAAPPFKKQFDTLSANQETCQKTIDGNSVITWKQALKQPIALDGYLQYKTPDHIKLSVLNPLNQPVFAFATDSKNFQAIDTTRKVYHAGSLRSYGLYNNLPTAFMELHWASLIAGQVQPTTPHVIDLLQDRDKRGVWFAVSRAEDSDHPTEYLLIDNDISMILQRIVVGQNGRKIAEVIYEDWQSIDGCDHPVAIRISGLSFGSEAELKFSDLQPLVLKNDDFKLPIPPAYTRRLLP